MMTHMNAATGTAQEPQDKQTVLLEKILEQLQISNVKLYGTSDADDEHATGRLPKVEASTKRAHYRIDKIEKKVLYVSGMATVAGVILGPWIQSLFISKPH